MKAILAISGSIAAYKSAHVGRLLKKREVEIKVVLTEAAQRFVTPFLFKSLLGAEVYTDEDYWTYEGALHIELAKWADIVLIAPATYNTISKIATGIADNLLTSLVAAFKGPVVIAPAMHSGMWKNPVLQENIEKLLGKGNFFLSGPAEGDLASGERGTGRFLEEEYIVEDVIAAYRNFPLKHRKILLTYGRTEEDIDEVRVITNRSSGLMGIALAKKIKESGGELIQVVGETSYTPYGRDKIIKTRSTSEMLEAVKEKVKDVDVLIMAAAVCDYQPGKAEKGKIKKGQELTLSFIETPDILKEVSKFKKENQIFVGFALEAENLVQNAKKKLKEKSLDIVVANHINAMGSERSSGYIITRGGEIEEFKNFTKEHLAEKIITKILQFL